jgi:hypothetical protein
MISNEQIEAYNSRPRIDLNNIKKMSAAQLDHIKTYGSRAENLLHNRDVAEFIHHYKFELLDQLSSITEHTQEDNAKRVAIGNHLAGIDGFIASLQRAKYYKDKIVSQQTQKIVESEGPIN